MRVIRESDGHLTANDVFEHARRLLPGISHATVYNSLRYLKKEGLIGEVKFECVRELLWILQEVSRDLLIGRLLTLSRSRGSLIDFGALLFSEQCYLQGPFKR